MLVGYYFLKAFPSCVQVFLKKKIKMSGRWQLRGKKIQEIVKMDRTATISNYFSKHSGSQNHYAKNYTEKKYVFLMQVC